MEDHEVLCVSSEFVVFVFVLSREVESFQALESHLGRSYRMKLSDPIADLFTRIRNAINVDHTELLVPYSNIKLAIIKILKEEGFIESFEVDDEGNVKRNIKVVLKYAPSGRSVISGLKRVSLPSKRLYVQKSEIPKVKNGFGICIVSTSKGVLSGRAARKANVGGELIGEVY